MKTKIHILVLVLCLSLLSSFSDAQGVWEIQNPLPTCENLTCSYCLPNTTNAWAVGSSGTILKTVDGNTWTNMNSGTTSYLYGVHFINDNIGWVVGSNGTIIKTTNGSSTWISETSGTTLNLFSVHFIDANIGFVAGGKADGNGGSGIVLKTINGGSTWTVLLSGYAYDLYSLDFVDSNTGWVVGQNGTILKTINGGNTWAVQTSNTTDFLKTIHFVDSNIGWAVGWSIPGTGTILKTINGGTTWTAQTSGVTAQLSDCFFADANTGWIAGSGYILKTTNGGTNWLVKSNITYDTYSGVCFSDATSGWVVGSRILKTIDGGSTWISLTTGVAKYLNGINFSDANSGCAVGVNGTILKTINGGSNWTAQTSGTLNDLFDVQFVDANTGWVVGQNGTILKTINGGSSWTVQPSGTSDYLYKVFFINANTGWAVGGPPSYTSGTILITTNGGTSWAAQTNGSSKPLRYVHFTDANAGLAFAQGSPSATLLKTTNGGTTWTTQIVNLGLNEVSFIDSDIGWATGYNNWGYLYKTTNGGTTWTTISSSPAFGALYFIDATRGWVSSWNGSTNFMQKTTDGGSNWLYEKIPSQPISSEYFINPKIGWAVGGNGMIIHTDFSPSTQANSISITNTTDQSINVSWTRGNGTQNALFVKQTNTGTCTPDMNATYLPNATFGLGDQIGSTGWYCVYNGSGTSASISGLQANTAYRFKVCEYNFSPDFTHYNSTTATNNPITATTEIAPPQITGNPADKALCEPLNTTFSVTTSGSGLSYQWQADAGSSYLNLTNGGVYSGCTTSTLSLNGIPASLNGYKYHCIVTNTSGSATSTGALLTVNPLPAIPSDISGTQVACLNNSYPYTLPPVQFATSYAWTYPAGFSGTSTTNNINLTTSSGAVPGNITVMGLNGCGSGPVKSFPVSVNTVPAAIGTISGSSNVCKNQNNVMYSINAIPNATSYVWTSPDGITGSNSTNNVSLNIGPDAYSGDLKVSGVNSCGTGAEIVFQVIVDAVPDPSGAITGPAKVCGGETNVEYSVPKSDRATSYVWDLPDGTSETTIANKIALNFDNNTISGDLTVSPANSCGSGNSKSLYIAVTVPSKPEITSDNYKAGSCLGDTPLKLNVKEALPGYNYLWSKNGVLITTAPSSFLEGYLSSGDYTVEADLDGCISQSEIFKVLFPDAPEKPVIYSKGPTIWYLTCSNENAAHYKWYYNGNLIPEATGYLYVANQNLGKYFVSIGNDKGCFTASDEITIPPVITGLEDVDLGKGIKIYPNPTTGKFTLEMDNDFYGELGISVLNQAGKEVLKVKVKKTTEQFSTPIDLSGQAKGLYFVNIKSGRYFKTNKIAIE